MLFDFTYKLNPEERMIGLVRKHWFLLVAPLAEYLIIIALLAVFVNRVLIFRQSALISLALGFAYIIYLVYRWVIWRADFYIITNERILKIAQGGVLDRTLREALLKDISDIALKTRGLAASILKFGTIEILLGNGRIFKLENISRPDKVYQAIVKLKEI